MSDKELNAILFYADFMSLQAYAIPITDNCKYFYIHGAPVNSAFILDLRPKYNKDNKFFKKALEEYEIIKGKYGEDGIDSFIDDVCSIKACGCVDAERMLNCIHQYSNKQQRRRAFDTYKKWQESLSYTHITINENGDEERKPCSKYVAHAEELLRRRKLQNGAAENAESVEKLPKNESHE